MSLRSQQLRDNAVQLYVQGKSSAQVAAELGVSSGFVKLWVSRSGLTRGVGLEQGLRGAASAYRVFTVGGDEIQTPDTSEILSALRNSAYQLVIVNVTSGMAAVKITEDAANAGFTYGIFVSRYRRLHGYAQLFNNGCAEFVQLFPAIPEVLRKQLLQDIQDRHA